MDMITVPVTIPKDMAPYIDWEGEGLSLVQKALLLYPMIQDLVISYGRAAEILGIHKWKLIELYSKLGISCLNLSRADLEEEIAGFARLKEKRTNGRGQ